MTKVVNFQVNIIINGFNKQKIGPKTKPIPESQSNFKIVLLVSLIGKLHFAFLDFLNLLITLDLNRWLTPFLLKGFKTNLRDEDLYHVLPDDESKYLGDKLER